MIGGVGPNIQIVNKGRAAAWKIHGIVDRAPPIDRRKEGGRKLKRNEVEGVLRFEGVDFSYVESESAGLDGVEAGKGDAKKVDPVDGELETAAGQ